MALDYDYQLKVNTIFYNSRQNGESIQEILNKIYASFNTSNFIIAERVEFAGYILNLLTKSDREILIKQLLNEQVIKQRKKLSMWGAFNAQTSQIDTGYIAQHLLSFITQIPGQGMRGKGDDLADGSEIKSANFLDSMDKAGATAPRWNFTAVTVEIMENFLNYDKLYLVSLDLNESSKFRIRVWKVDVTQHEILRERYILWMETLGYPKFRAVNKPSVNFQLFPPRNGTDDNYARHGNGRGTGFPKLEIHLEGVRGSDLIFHAEETDNGIEIYKF
ncbi:MamI family restriction endonuclease [Fusobacterium ulcerans]|uniref:MamI family restriction endonuclease n=1 Tax=Fusobacterium ulcerans TaxID=861 RepID=UPI001D0A51AC|nr:MamI family restriction endonuclease [Fusobacterium ulcerans]MCB8565796.1 MamI family restriction endonuclease [Fusobacterium ulcerans]MCB8650637.1 MamI family restriction endonuclease [Fusobacterium ulcerans]